MLTVAMQQPYFCPYPGFFEKMARADVFALLDCVQFPRGGGWLTRNRFKNDGGAFWIRVPVRRKGLFPQGIDQVVIADDEGFGDKALAALGAAYGKAPYWGEHADFLARTLAGARGRLLDLNVAFIRHLARALGIATPLVLLSELGVAERGESLPGAICRALGAGRYLSQAACEPRVDVAALGEKGIEAAFFRPARLVYPQLWGDFIANLSTWDLIMCCGGRSGALLGATSPPARSDYR